jgi:hypothetical protein
MYAIVRAIDAAMCSVLACMSVSVWLYVSFG